MVSIAGSGISAAEQETYRTGALMKADGFSDADIARAQAFQRQKFRVAKTGLGWDALDSMMKQLRADSTRWFPGYGTGAATRSLASLRMYGVLQFNYEPTRDLRMIKAPVRVIMGERDRNFPPQVVIDRMRDALRSGGNTNFAARIIPGASHGLMTVQTIDGRPFRSAVSPQFLSTLETWVSRVAHR
jgi:pimeloyl-ACP methyl ester carboxylesterase